MNFIKLLEKLFSRTLPSNHLSHDVIFSPFLHIIEVCSLKSVHLVEQWYIRRRNSQPYSILCSYGNQVETSSSSWGHTYSDLGISIAGEVEENEKLKNLLNRAVVAWGGTKGDLPPSPQNLLTFWLLNFFIISDNKMKLNNLQCQKPRFSITCTNSLQI